jgi:hypothetical protein
MWLIVLPLMFKLSPLVVSPRVRVWIGVQFRTFDPWKHCSQCGLCPRLIVLFTTSSWSFCCEKSAVLAAPCLVNFFFRVHFVPRIREKYRSTLAELPMPVQGYILWDVVRFRRGSVKTHHTCAIHPFSTDEGKPHMTPWGWGDGPRSPTYSETDLPQGQVPGYPPPADLPGSHSSLGTGGI